MTTLADTKQDVTAANRYFHAKNEFTAGPMELSYLMKKERDSIRIVDVRQKDDYDKEHISGSINLPREEWQTERGLSKDKVNIFLCYTQQCHLATKAAENFSAKGYPAMELEGGFEAWKNYGLETTA